MERRKRRKWHSKRDGVLVVSSQNHVYVVLVSEPPWNRTVTSNIPDLSLSVHTFYAHTRTFMTSS